LFGTWLNESTFLFIPLSIFLLNSVVASFETRNFYFVKTVSNPKGLKVLFELNTNADIERARRRILADYFYAATAAYCVIKSVHHHIAHKSKSVDDIAFTNCI